MVICLPDGASPHRIGLPCLLNKVQAQTYFDPFFVQSQVDHLNANSSLIHILCKWNLKLLADVAETVEFSRLFHQFITLSEKKWRGCLVLLLFFFSLQSCPPVLLPWSASKKVSSCTDDKPWTILYTSINSALILRSSEWPQFQFSQSVTIWDMLQSGIILVKHLWIFFSKIAYPLHKLTH